jgi:hypothetical protein
MAQPTRARLSPGGKRVLRAGGRLTRTLAALAAAGLLADQVLQHTALADGVFLGRCVAPFDPPLFSPAQRQALDALRRGVAGDELYVETSAFDPELGWCPRPSSSSMGASFDALGARAGTRPHAAQPAAGGRRVIALGCSFTLGLEVGDAEAWPALVEAAEPGLEVVNLGVAGYGLDQAYLRYLRDGTELGAEEVWLGLMPEGAPRVATQYAPTCLRWASTCAFKPRFVPDPGSSGGLRLVPSPARSLEQTLRLLDDQEAFVAALGGTDLWVRRTPAAYAPRGTSPAHWFAATRLALTLYERRGGSPAWLQDPDSEVYRVLRGVVIKLRDDCGAGGARLRLAVLPSRPDLRGAAYWDDLVDDLRAAGVDCFDASPPLRLAGGAAEPALWMPQEHYSPKGNAVVADAIRAAWR